MSTTVPEFTHDYVARAACGCVVALFTDMGDKATARFAADEIKKGHVLDRVPLAEAVAALKPWR